MPSASKVPENKNHHARKVNAVFPDSAEKNLFGEPSLEVSQFRQSMNGLGVVASLRKDQKFVELFHFAVGNFAVGEVQFFGLPIIVAAFALAVFKRVDILAQRRVAAEFGVPRKTFVF